jgi:hypothetical protein
VWIGPFYANESAANQAADNFARQFQRYGLDAGQFMPQKMN